MHNPTLLALFAHPDDETFGSGGTMAHYAAQNVKIALVCATRGEEGEISDPSLATPETLSAVREQELRCAADVLGISELIFLDYRDSGMAGSSSNERADGFIKQPAEQVVRELVPIIRRLRPQVVVTFDPKGGYGHPDHIAIHQHTVAAFHAAVDPSYAPEEGAPWQATRLFYSVIPRSMMERFREQLAEEGNEKMVEQIESQEAGWPDDQIDVTMDLSSYAETKWRALNCHRTQFGEEHVMRKMPDESREAILHREHFVLAWPDHSTLSSHDDLFAGL